MSPTGTLLSLALTVIAICTGLGFMGGAGWFFALFDHFRLQWGVAAGLLLFGALVFRHRALAIVALAAIGLNMAAVAWGLAAFPATAPITPAQSFTLVSANVQAANDHPGRLVSLVERLRPDILVAIEIDEAWREALDALPAEYAHRLVTPRSDNFGMAVYSRRPFEGRSVASIADGLPIMQLNFGSFSLLAAHPPPPIGSANAARHRAYIADMVSFAVSDSTPVVITGDMNATAWSRALRPLADAGFTPANRTGLAWTWPTGFAPLALQIDHVFARGARITSFETLPAIGSDHFPLHAVVTMGKEKRTRQRLAGAPGSAGSRPAPAPLADAGRKPAGDQSNRSVN
jgi:endonuclease/exonuclease/phosphatase (EEP) superfamily protein YafD